MNSRANFKHSTCNLHLPRSMQRSNDRCFVGPEKGKLKIRDPKRLDFAPKEFLELIAAIYVHFARKDQNNAFAQAIAADKRSYYSKMFTEAATVSSAYFLFFSQLYLMSKVWSPSGAILQKQYRSSLIQFGTSCLFSLSFLFVLLRHPDLAFRRGRFFSHVLMHVTSIRLTKRMILSSVELATWEWRGVFFCSTRWSSEQLSVEISSIYRCWGSIGY